MSYSTIVVGTDGSDYALDAVHRAAELSSTNSALLVVVCAYSPLTAREQAVLNTSFAEARLERARGAAAAEAAVDAAAGHAHRSGAVGVTGVLVDGDPASALLRAASERAADLVVVGNRGLNTLSGRLLGSVAAAVSRRATCDVLVVHTAHDRHG